MYVSGIGSRRCTPELADLAASGRLPTPEPAASATQPARIRSAYAADRPALAEMLSRCTRSTRSRRFLAPLRSFPEPYLTEALSGHPEHFALVAATPAAVVALASCRAVAGGTAEDLRSRGAQNPCTTSS